MKRKQFEDLLKVAAKKYSEDKKQAKRPETQFKAGAMWLWSLLFDEKDIVFYEKMLRDDLNDRTGKVDEWKESLITETAKMMVRRDRLEAEIIRKGDLLEKYDKNENPYYESNPLHVHLKELDRSIGMQREHLGLSNKINVERIKGSAKQPDIKDDPTYTWMRGKR